MGALFRKGVIFSSKKSALADQKKLVSCQGNLLWVHCYIYTALDMSKVILGTFQSVYSHNTTIHSLGNVCGLTGLTAHLMRSMMTGLGVVGDGARGNHTRDV